jgi:hypothetical protein
MSPRYCTLANVISVQHMLLHYNVYTATSSYVNTENVVNKLASPRTERREARRRKRLPFVV